MNHEIVIYITVPLPKSVPPWVKRTEENLEAYRRYHQYLIRQQSRGQESNEDFLLFNIFGESPSGNPDEIDTGEPS